MKVALDVSVGAFNPGCVDIAKVEMMAHPRRHEVFSDRENVFLEVVPYFRFFSKHVLQGGQVLLIDSHSFGVEESAELLLEEDISLFRLVRVGQKVPLAMGGDVLIDVPDTEVVFRFREDFLHGHSQSLVTVSDKDWGDPIWVPKASCCLHRPLVIVFTFSGHETKTDTESLVGGSLTNKMEERELVKIGLVCSIDQGDMVKDLGKVKRTRMSKEQIFD